MRCGSHPIRSHSRVRSRKRNSVMNKAEAAVALGISLRSLERRMSNGRVRFTRSGEGQYAQVFFDPADLGLSEPEKGSVAAPQSPDLPAVDPVVPPEIAPLPINEYAASVFDASDEELRRRVALGCRPDDPGGRPSNAPCIGSSTMPSPFNFRRANEARSELQKRGFAGCTPVRTRPCGPVYWGHRDEALAKHNSMVANLGKID
jgi:hypothetical protein